MPSLSVPCVPAAADALLAPLLAGPPRRAEIVAATPLAVYARLEDGAVVGVLDRGAVRVPGSVVAARARPGDVAVGDEVVVGDGGVGIGGVRLVPARWWDSRVPVLGRPERAPVPAPLPDAVPGVAAGLEPALVAGDGIDDVVDALVGLGPGLTPAGDDVLAGALVALIAAANVDRSACLAAAVRLRGHRTTALSAALLDHAAAGRAIPELARYVVALARGPAVGAVVQDLERVGASSGAALAAGARIGSRAAAIVEEREAAEVA